MKHFFLIIWLLIFLFFNINVIKSQSKEDDFNYFKDKLSKLETISFNFVSMNDPNYKGYLIADKTNKFKLSLPDRLLVCDGESVWNYDSKLKQVVISDFNKTQSASLQTIFFNITENYKPTNLQTATSTKNKHYKILTLSSINNPNEIIELNYDDKYNLISIKFNVAKNSGHFKILNLKFNPKTKKGTFEFKTPKDVEEIDLR